MSDGCSVFLTAPCQHPSLRGIVAYYYLHFSDDNEFKLDFSYYPHWRNALTFYKGAKVVFNDFESKVVSAPEAIAPTGLFSRNYTHAIPVRMRGSFFKLGIAFEPLGFNHFLAHPLREQYPKTVNMAEPFAGQLQSCIDHLYASRKLDVSLLDNALVELLQPFEATRLKAALDILHTAEEMPKVEALAERLATTRKTLLRDFDKHLATSVAVYRNMIRFRKAMNHYHLAAGKERFTDLAMQHSYYDQPAFIKHFKQITGKSPRRFFAGLQRFGEEDTFWRRE